MIVISQAYWDIVKFKFKLIFKLSKPNIKCVISENYSFGNSENNVSSGLYTFSFKDEIGNTIFVPARYTFVVNRNRIVDHHSSEEPTK